MYLNIKISLLSMVLICVACDYSGSELLTKQEQAKDALVRKFLSETINADSGEALKQVCIKNVDAVYLILNDDGLLERMKLPEAIQESIKKLLKPELKGRTTSKLKTIFEGYVGAQDYDDGYKSLKKTVETFDFALIAKNLESINIDLGSDWKKFFKDILMQYFGRLNLEDRRRIFSYIVANAKADAPQSEWALLAIYASGPYFQKLIQLVSEKIIADNEDLEKLKFELGKVKSKLPSIAKVEIDRYLADLKAHGYEIEIGKSIGAASVGEVFHAKYKGRGIVIKFMRPGLEEIAARERTIFHDIAASISTGMLKSVTEITKSVDEELDFREEAKKLIRGAEIYDDPRLPIYVAELVKDFPTEQYWMAMELAPGNSFQSFDYCLLEPKADAILVFSKAILLNLLTREVTEKTFYPKPGEPGFFHGDLHEGNLMVYIHPSVYDKFASVEEVNSKSVWKAMHEKCDDGKYCIRLTILDFGNAHEMTHEQSAALLNMLIAAGELSDSPDAFLEAFQILVGDGDTDPDELEAIYPVDLLAKLRRKAFKPREIDPKRDFTQTLGKAMDVMMGNNIPIPGKAMAFLRTVGMLSNDYVTVKKEAASMNYCFETLNWENKEISGTIGKHFGACTILPGGYSCGSMSRYNYYSFISGAGWPYMWTYGLKKMGLEAEYVTPSAILKNCVKKWTEPES